MRYELTDPSSKSIAHTVRHMDDHELSRYINIPTQTPAGESWRERARALAVHTRVSNVSIMSWIIALVMLRYIPNLTHVTIDIYDLACGLGCCRLSAVRELEYLLATTVLNAGTEIRFKGIENGEEEARLSRWA